VLSASSTHIQAILSTPEDELSALNSVKAVETFANAPKIPNISLDHFWRCSDAGCHRAKLSTTDVCLPMLSDFTITDLDAHTEKSNAPKSNFSAGRIVKCLVQGDRGRSKAYLSVVLESDGDQVCLKFLRQTRRGSFSLPRENDVSWEPLENISDVEPQPVKDKRGNFLFHPHSNPLN
jgi:hypothetical protein